MDLNPISKGKTNILDYVNSYIECCNIVGSDVSGSTSDRTEHEAEKKAGTWSSKIVKIEIRLEGKRAKHLKTKILIPKHPKEFRNITNFRR